jgi:hypothetical protein
VALCWNRRSFIHSKECTCTNVEPAIKSDDPSDPPKVRKNVKLHWWDVVWATISTQRFWLFVELKEVALWHAPELRFERYKRANLAPSEAYSTAFLTHTQNQAIVLACFPLYWRYPVTQPITSIRILHSLDHVQLSATWAPWQGSPKGNTRKWFLYYTRVRKMGFCSMHWMQKNRKAGFEAWMQLLSGAVDATSW